MKRKKNITAPGSCSGLVQQLLFHPAHPVAALLTSERQIKLFCIEEGRRRLLHTVAFADISVRAFQFVQAGRRIAVGGGSKGMYFCDVTPSEISQPAWTNRKDILPVSRMVVDPDEKYLAVVFTDGSVSLMAQPGMLAVAELRAGKPVRDVCFGGTRLYGVCSDGELLIWDLRRMAPHAGVAAQGGLAGTRVAAGLSVVACGAENGIVSLYDVQEECALRKMLGNVCTEIDTLCLHPSEQLLFAGSSQKKGAARLVNTNDSTVYQNWPAASEAGRMTAAAFSPCGNYLGLGMADNTARLYQLEYFSSFSINGSTEK